MPLGSSSGRWVPGGAADPASRRPAIEFLPQGRRGSRLFVPWLRPVAGWQGGVPDPGKQLLPLLPCENDLGEHGSIPDEELVDLCARDANGPDVLVRERCVAHIVAGAV